MNIEKVNISEPWVHRNRLTEEICLPSSTMKALDAVPDTGSLASPWWLAPQHSSAQVLQATCCGAAIFIHCKYALLSLVNKRADWPIAGQEEIGQESQTRRMLGRRSRR